MTAADSVREPCPDCVRKHLGQAMVLLQESIHGYPDHFWLAVGHLAEAEAEIQGLWPDLAESFRAERKRMEEEKGYMPEIIPYIHEVTKRVIDKAVKEASSKVERTKPGSDLDFRVTYSTGAKKWTNDRPGDGKNPTREKEMENLFKRGDVKRALKRLEVAVGQYLKDGNQKPIEEAADSMVVDAGDDVAKNVIRDVYKAEKDKGSKEEVIKALGIAKDRVNSKTASAITADVGLVLRKIIDRVTDKELARAMGKRVLDYSRTKNDRDDLSPDQVRMLYRQDHYGERERLTKKNDLYVDWTDHAEYHGDLRDMDPGVVNDAIAEIMRNKLTPEKGKKPKLRSQGPERMKAPGVGTMVVDYDLTTKPAEADIVTVWASEKESKVKSQQETFMEVLLASNLEEVAGEITERIMKPVMEYFEDGKPFSKMKISPGERFTLEGCLGGYEIEVDYFLSNNTTTIFNASERYISLKILNRDSLNGKDANFKYEYAKLYGEVADIVEHEMGHYYLGKMADAGECIYYTRGFSAYFEDPQEMVLHSKVVWNEIKRRDKEILNRTIDSIERIVGRGVESLEWKVGVPGAKFPKKLQKKYVDLIMKYYVSPALKGKVASSGWRML